MHVNKGLIKCDASGCKQITYGTEEGHGWLCILHLQYCTTGRLEALCVCARARAQGGRDRWVYGKSQHRDQIALGPLKPYGSIFWWRVDCYLKKGPPQLLAAGAGHTWGWFCFRPATTVSIRARGDFYPSTASLFATQSSTRGTGIFHGGQDAAECGGS